MQNILIVLVIFGVVVIAFPAIISYLIGGLLVFIGINIFMFGKQFGKKGASKKDYVKFGDYKIFRGKK
ncbi:hypothetical protein LR004_02200 [Candidatus Gracilibacteria bacterium]|nr:hypothetical protein [Candidatus Gracilibacteria bacterium]